jgi:phosphatidylserine/phosphatidylglycerophosphate/cardiolipin synthase-like enzyme
MCQRLDIEVAVGGKRLEILEFGRLFDRAAVRIRQLEPDLIARAGSASVSARQSGVKNITAAAFTGETDPEEVHEYLLRYRARVAELVGHGRAVARG